MSGDVLAQFRSTTLAGLSKRTTPGSAPSLSQAQRIQLDLIDEDPDQPRRTFDEAVIADMAASIELVGGVVTPVTVRTAPGGRYLLSDGACRVRASRRLGLPDIPAVLADEGQDALLRQAVANGQRTGLSDSDTAAVIARLSAQKLKGRAIATALGIRDEQSLKYWRALDGVRQVPALAAWINRGAVRALYMLRLEWDDWDDGQREQAAAALELLEELTVTAARRIIGGATVTNGTTVKTTQADAAETSAEAEPVAAPKQAARRTDPDAARLARVRAWIADPARPRPPLSV